MRETVKNRATAHRFAFYPPVPLVRRASSFRPASALFHPPTGLSTVRRKRHAMCPTDVCHSNDFYCTRTSRIPSSLSRLAPGGHSAESLVSAQYDRGDGRFTTSEPLRRISSNTLSTLWSVPRRGRHRPRSQAWAFSSHGARCDRASDIPVASHSFPQSHEPSPVQPLSRFRPRPFGCACGSLG